MFQPTFDKFAGHLAGGCQIHVTDRRVFRPFNTSLNIISAVRRLYGEKLKWLPPPYEYDYTHLPIEILTGRRDLVRAMEEGANFKG
jgi:uncharacterized protein YbbC (DUF1343 family)